MPGAGRAVFREHDHYFPGEGYRVAPMFEQALLDIFDARANMEAMVIGV